MNDFEENISGVLQTESGVSIAYLHEDGGYHHHLINCPRLDHIVYQSYQKMQPP